MPMEGKFAKHTPNTGVLLRDEQQTSWSIYSVHSTDSNSGSDGSSTFWLNRAPFSYFLLVRYLLLAPLCDSLILAIDVAATSLVPYSVVGFRCST